MNEGLRCQIVSDFSKLEKLTPRWLSLLEQTEGPEPTLTPLWMLEWWRVFGKLEGRELRVCTFQKEDELVGIVPLLLRTRWHSGAIPFRALELLCSGESEEDEICSDYVGVIARRGLEAEVCGAFAKALSEGELGGWDELVMPAMDGSSLVPKLLAGALLDAGIWAETTDVMESPHIKLPRSFQEYLASLSSSGRYLVNRSLRDFQKWAGKDWEMRRASTRSELEAGKLLLMQLHEQRWSSDGRSGVFSSARFRAFHESVLPRLFDANALDLSWLTVRGSPVAILYNIVWNNKVYFYQSGRRTDLPKGIRPGIVIHARAIERSIELGLREYDFLAGTSRYKLQLATGRRQLVQLRAARPSVREVVRRIASQGADRVRRIRSAIRSSVPPGLLSSKPPAKRSTEGSDSSE